MKVHGATYHNTIIFNAENTILGFYINVLNITSEEKKIQNLFSFM